MRTIRLGHNIEERGFEPTPTPPRGRKKHEKQKEAEFGLLSAVEIILAGEEEPIPNF